MSYMKWYPQLSLEQSKTSKVHTAGGTGPASELIQRLVYAALPDVTAPDNDEAYFAHPALSNSDLRIYREEGPENFHYYKYGGKPREDKEAFKFGSLFHCLCLEPTEMKKRFCVFNGEEPTSPQMRSFVKEMLKDDTTPLEAYLRFYSNKGTTAKLNEAATELWTRMFDFIGLQRGLGGRQVISEKDTSLAKQMKDALYAHAIWDLIHKTCVDIFFEEAILATHTATGLVVKGKLDMVALDHDTRTLWYVDLKTTKCSSLASFKSSAKTYGYDTQAAHYQALLRVKYADLITAGYNIRVVLGACQKDYPFQVHFFEFSTEVVQKAETKLLNALQWVARHQVNNNWKYHDILPIEW